MIDGLISDGGIVDTFGNDMPTDTHDDTSFMSIDVFDGLLVDQCTIGLLFSLINVSVLIRLVLLWLYYVINVYLVYVLHCFYMYVCTMVLSLVQFVFFCFVYINQVKLINLIFGRWIIIWLYHTVSIIL